MTMLINTWVRRGGLTSALVALAAFGLFGCKPRPAGVWQGYVEAEFVRVGSPLSGMVETLLVHRGDTVTNGQPLFTLERTADLAAVREAEERLSQARSRLENLTKGRRPTEIQSLEARLEQARAAQALAEKEWTRTVQLLKDGAIARADQDRAVSVRDQASKQVEAVEAELATARLGAREDEVRAAEAEVTAAGAVVTRARWAVEQKQRAAVADGLVQDTLFNPGEFVPAGAPVVSLLPPGRLKVRFFVPEAEVSRMRVGQSLRVRLDGVAQALPARLAYVAPQVEYTPPVIYSQENRSKLVFMCEAAFESPDATRLHPGQPVEVQAAPTTP